MNPHDNADADADADRAESNSDTQVAWEFHDGTKYVAGRDPDGDLLILMGTPPHVENAIWEEDRSLVPFPYKIYETLDPIALADDGPPSAMPAWSALTATGLETDRVSMPDKATLGRIGLLSNGLLGRHGSHGRGPTFEYRTAGGTGARYHLEEYFVCGDLPDLPAGVYHYAAHDHSLRLVRAGDFRGLLTAASGDEPALEQAPVILVLTSTFWRNAWRYKARAYRHTYWDAGTSLSQVLAVAASAGLTAKVVLGYADAAVNEVLDVDGVREAAVAVCALGHDGPPAPAAGVDVPPLGLATRAISPGEVAFPLIPRMHAASSLRSAEEARAWRSGAFRRTPKEPSGPLVPLSPLTDLPAGPVEDVIRRRRSTRNYDLAADLPFTAFSTLLDLGGRGFPADCLVPGAPSLHDCYLLVHRVEGLAPGVYLHHRDLRAVQLLREGDVRDQAMRLAVGQGYVADAHVNAYYLTDLHDVLAAYGNRGYRLAQLECALYAGKLHLGTHAVEHRDVRAGVAGLGAVGSTSFDDEVVDFLSPHAAGKSYMFVTVFGRRRLPR